MIGLAFVHPEWVHLVWIVLAVMGVLGWLELRSAEALSRFISPVMQERLAQRPSPVRRIARLALVGASLLLGVVTLMRPQSSRATQEAVQTKVNADLMVVIDTSKSMLAEDAAPNRLARAKAEIRDLIAPLSGSRLGLVAFAGRAAVLCPLTTDHGFFRLVLDGVDTRSAGRGGTRIGDAIRKAVQAFPAGGTGARVILLFTDGEDQDSYPLDAAKEAKAAGVRVVAVGFGDEKGSEVMTVDPATGGKSPLVDRNGVAVKSRLDGETLRQIALATEGAYVPAGVASLDIRSIVEQHIKPLLRDTKTSQVRVIHAERYPWFLLASLLAMLGAVWLGAPEPRRNAGR